MNFSIHLTTKYSIKFYSKITVRINDIRSFIKDLCKSRNITSILKFKELVAELKKLLNPRDILKHINDYINAPDFQENENNNIVINFKFKS